LLKRWFGGKEGLIVKPERSILPHHGDKWNERYDASYHPKTEATSQHSAALIGLAKLLRDNDSKAFEAGMAKVLDIDQFLNYVAVSVIIANLDSPLNLPHNYYLAVPDDRKLVVWIPWDLNLSLAGFTLAGSAQADLSVMEPSRLPVLNRVLDIARYEDKYRQLLRKLIKGCCSAKTLTAHIKTARTATGTALKQEETRSQRVTETPADLSDGTGFARWGRGRGGVSRFFGSRQTLEEFVVAREKSVIDQLDGKSQGRRAGFSFGFGLGNRGNRGNRGAGGWNPFTTRDDSSTRLRRMLATGGLLAKDQGSFTVDEVRAAAGKLFARLNTDATGGLDADEIKPALVGLPMDGGTRRRSPRRAEALASRRARRLVRDLDSDKHGTKDRELTAAEWLAGVDRWFPRWDTNSDDMLDQQELAGRGSRR